MILLLSEDYDRRTLRRTKRGSDAEQNPFRYSYIGGEHPDLAEDQPRARPGQIQGSLTPRFVRNGDCGYGSAKQPHHFGAIFKPGREQAGVERVGIQARENLLNLGAGVCLMIFGFIGRYGERKQQD